MTIAEVPTDLDQPAHPFTLYSGIQSCEYARVLLQRRIRQNETMGFTGEYDKLVLRDMEALLDYLKTEWSERAGVDYPGFGS